MARWQIVRLCYMAVMFHRFLLVLFAIGLASCESRELNQLSLKEYEGPEGEAVVRHLLKTMPEVAPGVPKVYTVVKGPRLHSTKMDFVRRMSDLKLNFVSGEVLTMMNDPERSTIDPRSGLAPLTIQLADIRRHGPASWEVQAGWAYKKIYERRHLVLVKTEAGYEVTRDERVEGNYLP
jgi:hypothetical protein